MPGDVDAVRMRGVLLDALEALAAHSTSVVVIGAQAVYFWTGATPLALAESTKDIDLALGSRSLEEAPLLEDLLAKAGFHPNPASRQPGAWTTADGIDVDLMVPEALAGRPSRRAASIPPHGKHVARRGRGIEAAVIDNSEQTLTALDPRDDRGIRARIASPGALLVAKLHKIGERLSENRGRALDKDAHDIYRLLTAVPTQRISDSWRFLLATDLTRGVTEDAVRMLRDLFALGPSAKGSEMAGRAESGIGDPQQVAASVSLLAAEALEDLERR